MGSKGSGSFSDYSGFRSKGNNTSKDQGGTSGIDQCELAFSSFLEEVSTCKYYRTKNKVPDIDSIVNISFEKRIIATTKEGICIGYLPTKYNYLRACMLDGFTYTGIVKESRTIPLPSICIDIEPKKNE